MSKLLFISLLAIFLMIPICGYSQNPAGSDQLFFKAGQAFRDGNFKEAASIYEKLLEETPNNGHLYYNLANAYFKSDRLGLAVLNYHRAHTFLPRDADLKFNLGLAMDQTVDAIAKQPDWLSATFFWLGSFSLSGFFIFFALINLVFWAVLLSRLFAKPDFSYYLLLLASLLMLAGGSSLALKYVQISGDNRAVIIAPEVSIMAGPDDKDTVLFKLHEGAMVLLERTEGAWRLLRLPDQKRGWAKADAVKRVIP